MKYPKSVQSARTTLLLHVIHRNFHKSSLLKLLSESHTHAHTHRKNPVFLAIIFRMILKFLGLFTFAANDLNKATANFPWCYFSMECVTPVPSQLLVVAASKRAYVNSFQHFTSASSSKDDNNNSNNIFKIYTIHTVVWCGAHMHSWMNRKLFVLRLN